MEIETKELILLLTKISNIVDGFDEFFLTKKYNLTIKDKLLVFLNEKPCTPYELINKLGLAKSNLALITASMIKDKLIVKEQESFDKRNIIYTITEKGREYIKEVIKIVDNNINKQLRYTKNAEKINELVKNLNELLN